MAQFNVFSMRDTAGAGADDRARDEANALAREATRQNMDIRRQGAAQNQMAFDQNQEYRQLMMLHEASTRMLDLQQNDPALYERMLPRVLQEFEGEGLLKAADVGEFDPQEWAEIQEITGMQLTGRTPRANLQKSTPYRVQKEDGSEVVVTPVFNPVDGTTELVESPYEGQVLSSLGETPQERSTREVSTTEDKEIVKGQQGRYAEAIEVGLRQADATAILRRGLELLDVIETGRPEEIMLRAKEMFGIAGADESELNANLGKAILAQLRDTFGAQFTKEEGDRLQYIEANFGKSTPGNRRLLENALRQAERAARRGIDAAGKADDQWSADEIKKALEFTVRPQDNESADEGDTGENVAPDGTVVTDASGRTLIKRNGKWVEQ